MVNDTINSLSMFLYVYVCLCMFMPWMVEHIDATHTLSSNIIKHAQHSISSHDGSRFYNDSYYPPPKQFLGDIGMRFRRALRPAGLISHKLPWLCPSNRLTFLFQTLLTSSLRKLLYWLGKFQKTKTQNGRLKSSFYSKISPITI